MASLRPIENRKCAFREQGAATSVWCATSPQLAGMGGGYCQDVDVAAIFPPDSPGNVGVRPYAIDPEAAERLWTLSDQLTGVKLDQPISANAPS